MEKQILGSPECVLPWRFCSCLFLLPVVRSAGGERALLGISQQNLPLLQLFWAEENSDFPRVLLQCWWGQELGCPSLVGVFQQRRLDFSAS